MPTWLMLAMATSLALSLTNLIDKAILDRYLKRGGTEVLVIFSAIFAVFGVPYAIYMEPGVLTIGAANAGIMFVVAVLNVILLWCYLKAMENDSPWKVVFFYQLVPVFSAVIGSFEFTLGETITTVEMLAMALIIVGTSIACVERTEGQKFTIKWRTVGLMLVATFFWATEMVIGKIVILEESVYHSIFWESTFMVCLGVFIWSVSSRSRRRFAIAMKVNKKWIIGLMLVGEAIYAFANSLSAHASEIKEVAIVMLTQPFQAIFVFIFGLLFAKWLPDVFGEITRTKLVQMALATTLAFAGTYLLL